MSFKPLNANKTGNSGTFESDNPGGLFPVPKSGSRKARVSLIVDLGIQKREDFEDEKTGETRPQKPCQQVAVFADLTADNVDYGGTIGKQHYRLLLNKSFSGNIQGINFVATPPKDAKGNIIAGKQWQLHPANLLTKLAKACNVPDVIESMEIDKLLGLAFMAQVDVNEKDSGKLDKDGEPIIYRNVNYKGCAEVPTVETGEEDEDGNPIEAKMAVPELKQPPLCITFDDAKAEDIKYLRKKLINMIKLAENYPGSKMQKAIEAFEAGQATSAPEEAEDEPEEPQKPAKAAPKSKAKPAKAAEPEDDEDEPDSPF